MDHEKVIQTISEMVSNENIYTDGLTMVYEVEEVRHRQLDEEFFIMIHGDLDGFEHSEEFETEIGGVLVKFVKKIAK